MAASPRRLLQGLEVLLHDEALIAVYKPAGLRAVPSFQGPPARASGEAAAADGGTEGGPPEPRKRKRFERWVEVVAGAAHPPVQALSPATPNPDVLAKLAREACSVPRKRHKFVSYAKRSLKIADASEAEGLWGLLEARLQQEEADAGFVTTDSVLSRVQAALKGTTVVHRLDQETSGVMVMAADPARAEVLNKQFRERSTAKTYLAVVYGHVEQDHGRVVLPLSPDPNDRPRQFVDHDRGKPAETDWRVLERLDHPPRTRVELHPLTGRTHQLRVHLASMGHPIVGDSLYATEFEHANEPKPPRMLLHAERLTFSHPSTLKPVSVHAPCPF